MPVTAPNDRRLLRGQIRPARRRVGGRSWWRTALRGALVLALLGLGFNAAVRLVEAPIARVDDIRVTGNTWLTGAEVLTLVEGLKGQSIFRVDLAAWRQRLLHSPWVADARLQRTLPSTIEVRIHERRPIGLGRVNGELFLVDENGTLIDRYGPRYAAFDLPVIDGLESRSAGGAVVDFSRIDLAGRLLRSLERRPDLASLVSQVDVSDPRDAVVILDQDTAKVRLGDDRFAERLQSYLELAPSLREKVPEIDYVDLRFGERVFVGPSPPPADAAPAQGTRRGRPMPRS